MQLLSDLSLSIYQVWQHHTCEFSFQKSLAQISLVRVIAQKYTMITLAPLKAVWDKGPDYILLTV